MTITMKHVKQIKPQYTKELPHNTRENKVGLYGKINVFRGV
jgi:hypothetical protein